MPTPSRAKRCGARARRSARPTYGIRAASDDRGSSFDERNEVAASGSYGFGPWGASASVKNTIGYVTTEQTRTTEEMNSRPISIRRSNSSSAATMCR